MSDKSLAKILQDLLDILPKVIECLKVLRDEQPARESIFTCGRCKQPLMYSCDCPPIHTPEGFGKRPEQASPTPREFKPYMEDREYYDPPQASPTPTECTQLLMNLLAVIHRDGGHYVADHALLKACEDAEAIVIKLLHAEGRSEQASPTPDKCPKCHGTLRYPPNNRLRADISGIFELCPDSWHSSASTPKGSK